MYRVVIIGAGNIGARFDSPESTQILTHAHAAMLHPDFELKGFYDRDKRKGMEAAQIWGVEVYTDLQTALENADVVSCCVPDSFHGQILKEVAGFHPKLVITEKPLAIRKAEIEELKKVYENRIPLVVNYSRRYLKEFCELKEEIRNYGRFLKGVGYYGKGFLHNGTHMVDLLNFLLKEIKVINVMKSEICDFTIDDPSKDVIFKIQHSNFYMISIDSRAATIFELELFFEKARVRILNGGEKLEIYFVKDSNIYRGYRNYKLQDEKYVDYSKAMYGLFENVSQFLKKGEPLKCSLKEGIDVLKICMSV